ncbi:MAG: phosphohydrolase [Rhodothermales bacterium]|nr:phosphohydrolase [Rhodothermales bacterium]
MPDQQLPDWTEPTPKEKQLDAVLRERSDGLLHDLLDRLLEDREINLFHSYANVVSVRRLGYNDHGPVHARITTYNALKILQLLEEAGIETSLESEQVGSFEDSQLGVALGCFLHDIGMSVTREEHEWHSIALADSFIVRYLSDLLPEEPARRIVIRSLAHEVIVGHMAHYRVHSIEAGAVMVADGTDMTKGRSRIPLGMDRDPSVGDMHRYSANSVRRVDISAGENKPVRLTIHMDDVTGLFQVEEVLMTKVKASPIMTHIEVVADVEGEEPRYYLR